MISNRTKIIATIGPACATPERLQQMVDAGVNVFRINMSHGDADTKREYCRLIHALSSPYGGRPAILADLAGPKIRVQDVPEGFAAREGQTVTITNDPNARAKENCVVVTTGFAFKAVQKGAKILINDGRVQLVVDKKTSPHTLECTTVLGGRIGQRKGVNFPGIELEVPPLTEQDKSDLRLALEEDVDWLALSFVRHPDDWELIQQELAAVGQSVPVMAKIEKWEALQYLTDIIDRFDGVMVARGDLGVEIPAEQVPLVQKRVIHEANHRRKPVLIATQMLESMIDHPLPTRAEVSDIANAVFDSADGLLVTGETAMGQYPVEVVKTLKRVVKETEATIQFGDDSLLLGAGHQTADAISRATCQLAGDLELPFIVTMTHTGSTARMISRYRPEGRIIALTPFEKTCRQLALVWGVSPFIVKSYSSVDDIPALCAEVLKQHKLLTDGDSYVVTGGVPIGVPGTTNYISVHSI